MKVATSSTWSKAIVNVRKKTSFKCLVCDQALGSDQKIDIHHITPKKFGGTDELKNLLRLHAECHKQVTHTKSPTIKALFKNKGILSKSLYSVCHFKSWSFEPCAMKVARTVLRGGKLVRVYLSQ